MEDFIRGYAPMPKPRISTRRLCPGRRKPWSLVESIDTANNPTRCISKLFIDERLFHLQGSEAREVETASRCCPGVKRRGSGSVCVWWELFNVGLLGGFVRQGLENHGNVFFVDAQSCWGNWFFYLFLLSPLHTTF